MFSRLLSGSIDWDKATPERKLEAIDQLATGDPLLARLALHDADAAVRHRALQRMDSAALWDLVPSVPPGDEEALAMRLAEQAADPAAAAASVPSPLLHAGTSLRIAVIAHTRSEELAAALLATLDEDADRVRVARGTGPVSVRAAATRELSDVALLEELAREFRDRQRQVYRAARERADELLAAENARSRARLLCEQMESAIDAQQITLTAVVHAEREFQALLPLPAGDGGAQLQARYERALARARVLLQGQADIGRDIERIKATLRSLVERSHSDEAVEPANLAALSAEREACAQSLADARFQALAGERSQLLANVEQLTERHAVIAVESRALATARSQLEALRADATLLSPAWRTQFAAAAAILRPTLRAPLEQDAKALIGPIEAGRQQQHDAQRAAGQQQRMDIEAVVKQLETSLDKGQRQQALELEQVLAEKRTGAEGQRALPPALEFRIRRCKERLAKLADWKRFGDTQAREALCREAEALAKRVTRQEQASARALVAPLQTFPWPVSPDTPQRAGREEQPAARHFVQQRENFAWPVSPDKARAARDAHPAPAATPSAESAETLTVEQIAHSVRDLQTRWQQLDAAKGTSSKGLWERFRRACDRAYAPARKHFEEREQQRAGNAGKKQAILDRLAALSERIVDGANWGRLLSERGELIRGWFDAGAPPRKQAQALQKRFDALSAEVDAKLDARRQAERARRQGLIAQAQAIAEKPAEGGSLSAMIALQKQWQDGMSGAIRLKAGEDKALWDAFRAAGNALFGKRDAEKAEREAGRKTQLEARRALIDELQALAGDPAKDTAALRRGMDELASRWQAMPWPERKPLREWEQKFSAARAAVLERMAAFRREAEGRQRTAALARLAVVERAERALTVGDTPDIAAVRTELLAMLGEGEKLDAAASARLETLEQAIKVGPEAWRAQAGKIEAERDALLLELEIVLDLPSPPELASARRMRMLKRLAESKNARSTPPLMAPDAPKAVARLLALPGGMQAVESRFAAILDASSRIRK